MAADIFLKIDGIEGETQDSKHSKEIEVLSWSWGATQTGTMGAGGGGGAGKVNVHDFSFTMHTNKSSPKLFLAVASGQHIKEASLTCRKAGTDQQEYYKFKFSDLLISSFQTGGSGGGEVPIESISINFSKVQMEYSEQKADGTLIGAVQAGWDVKKNQKV